MILLIFHLSTTNWTTFKLNMIYNIRRSAADNLSAISGHFMYSPRSGLARWFAEAAHKEAGEIRAVVEAGCEREFRDRTAFARARQSVVRPRAEERRDGQESVGTGRSRGLPSTSKKKN